MTWRELLAALAILGAMAWLAGRIAQLAAAVVG